ncbi:protein LURP-one-related 4-like [Actinidia eriantha]|uniref:protein LURP-one-related 4-like n=1 Tax=Actinidia eriantha TaxID=165200 RepID=UPI0025861A0F|nr:protein LURP-one-related 4-like [Actinidia eriantha]
MAKVHPQTQNTPTCSSSYMTYKKETFTLWMKSLVFHGNGCTVFDSNGEIVYRIDNYDKKSSNEVYLMDLQGKVLFSIRRKKLSVFGNWDIYRWNGSQMNQWFQARKNCNILGGDMACHVTLGCEKAKSSGYKILGLTEKLGFKIMDHRGELVAEVRPKQLSSGLMLGDDVLTLVVEPQMDHSLVMALVAVYGLITDKI